jgi:hypothetical protein
MKVNRRKLWITFLIPKWIVYACGLRLMNHYTKGEVWTKDKLELIRLTSALNRWLGNDGTEGQFKKQSRLSRFFMRRRTKL